MLAQYGPYGMVIVFGDDQSIAIANSDGSLNYNSSGSVANGALVGPSAKITYTAPSPKMTLQADGLYAFQAHNLYLNSAAPANQAITVLSGMTYAVTITGSVSVTASGAATGTWTAGTNTFTAATGTLTLGSTAGSGTVHVRRTPSNSSYVATAGAALYALPYVYSGGQAIGIATEQGRTNIVLRSQEFDDAAWVKSNVTVTANDAIAPDGTLTADLLTATGDALCYQNVTGTATTYTFSIWLKSATGGTIVVPWFANGSGSSPNPTSGNFTVTTEWTRFSVQTAVLAAALNIGLGNLGSGWAAGENVHAWGAQFEAGTEATSYIPTVASSVLRAFDNDFMLTSVFPLSATDGTWLIDAYHGTNPSNYAVVFECANGTRSNYVTAFSVSTTGARLQNYVSGTQAQYSVTTSVGARYIGAISTKTNDFNGAFDGVAGPADTSGTYQTSAFTRLQLGGASDASSFEGNCIIRRFAYFPYTKTAAELAVMTTP